MFALTNYNLHSIIPSFHLFLIEGAPRQRLKNTYNGTRPKLRSHSANYLNVAEDTTVISRKKISQILEKIKMSSKEIFKWILTSNLSFRCSLNIFKINKENKDKWSVIIPEEKRELINVNTFFSSSSNSIDVCSPVDFIHVRIGTKTTNTRNLQQ